MQRAHRIFFSAALLFITSIACATPAVTSAPDMAAPGALNTAIAQTVIAALTLTVPAVTVSPTLEPTSTFTFTPETPTLTPTETLTATLEFTATSSVTLISVSIPTNCRSGPGKVYEMEGALLVGQFAEVLGVDPTTNYWYIRNPDASSGAEFCWVWGKYATLTGSTSQLPIYTPQPTPVFTSTSLPTITPTSPPTFNADYVGLNNCNGQWWINIRLKNTSSVVFKSIYVSLKDKTNNETQVYLQNEFVYRNGCEEGSAKDIFSPGETYQISTPLFSHDLGNHEIKATITLCSDRDLNGFCSTRGVDRIP